MESYNNNQSLPMSIDSEMYSREYNRNVMETPQHNTNQKDVYRSIEEINPKYRHIFQYPYFNKMQSLVIDDVLYSDKSIVISAPTGSGKTAVFELAIVRLLDQLESMNYKDDFKIIYMAPMKALCSERLTDWYDKFGKVGVACIEVTGDSDALDFCQLKNYRIIMTTPEKWDSLTRRWKDNRQMVEVVKLFIIDEVHLLNEDVRGPVLEAVVSRMKTIQESLHTSNYSKNKNLIEDTSLKKDTECKLPITIRFLAASATIPNAEDIAEWLSTSNNPSSYYKVGEEYRPVKLNKIVEGYPSRDGQGLFKFDLYLNYKLKSTIEKHCDGKPTLIFCNTRKSVVLTAETLSRELLFHFTHGQTERFKHMASQLSEKKLQNLVLAGIGCHHAGFIQNDRNIIEQMFRRGELPVLITTSTLSMGVNLPAHLVIVKTTQHYVNGAYTEYDESSILQMIGRAGRPQFDTEGVAVIMTRNQDKERYEKLCSGQRAVESKLHHHLAEHLNAEVALGTLPDLLLAMDWLRSTFLYVRATRNPSNYGCSKLAGRESIEKKLQEICVKWMNALARVGLLIMDADTRVTSTETGILMATHCLDFDTMKLILKIKGEENLNQMVTLISECHEFEDVVLRASEKRCLNQLNKNNRSPCCRFPLPGRVQTKHMKTNCLIQAVLGSLPILDPSLNQESVKIMRIGENIAKCIVAYLTRTTLINSGKPIYKAVLNSIILAKCFAAKMWDNSEYVSRQLTGIGPAFASSLAAAGKTTFESIRMSNPRDLERIINKCPPAGNVLKKQVILLPIYAINLKTESNGSISLSLSILNHDDIKNNKSTTSDLHKISLIVGDSENNLLHYGIIMDMHILNMPKATINRTIFTKLNTFHTVFAHCISNAWVGLDVQASIDVEFVIKKPEQPCIEKFMVKTPKKLMCPVQNNDNDTNYGFTFESIFDESFENDEIESSQKVNREIHPKINKSMRNMNERSVNTNISQNIKGPMNEVEQIKAIMDKIKPSVDILLPGDNYGSKKNTTIKTNSKSKQICKTTTKKNIKSKTTKLDEIYSNLYEKKTVNLTTISNDEQFSTPVKYKSQNYPKKICANNLIAPKINEQENSIVTLNSKVNYHCISTPDSVVSTPKQKCTDNNYDLTRNKFNELNKNHDYNKPSCSYATSETKAINAHQLSEMSISSSESNYQANVLLDLIDEPFYNTEDNMSKKDFENDTLKNPEVEYEMEVLFQEIETLEDFNNDHDNIQQLDQLPTVEVVSDSVCLIEPNTNSAVKKGTDAEMICINKYCKGTILSLNNNTEKQGLQMPFYYVYKQISNLNIEMKFFNFFKNNLITLNIEKPINCYNSLMKTKGVKKQTKSVSWSDPLILPSLMKATTSGSNVRDKIVPQCIDSINHETSPKIKEHLASDIISNTINNKENILSETTESKTVKNLEEPDIPEPIKLSENKMDIVEKRNNIIKWINTSPFHIVPDLNDSAFTNINQNDGSAKENIEETSNLTDDTCGLQTDVEKIIRKYYLKHEEANGTKYNKIVNDRNTGLEETTNASQGEKFTKDFSTFINSHKSRNCIPPISHIFTHQDDTILHNYKENENNVTVVNDHHFDDIEELSFEDIHNPIEENIKFYNDQLTLKLSSEFDDSAQNDECILDPQWVITQTDNSQMNDFTLRPYKITKPQDNINEHIDNNTIQDYNNLNQYNLQFNAHKLNYDFEMNHFNNHAFEPPIPTITSFKRSSSNDIQLCKFKTQEEITKTNPFINPLVKTSYKVLNINTLKTFENTRKTKLMQTILKKRQYRRKKNYN